MFKDESILQLSLKLIIVSNSFHMKKTQTNDAEMFFQLLNIILYQHLHINLFCIPQKQQQQLLGGRGRIRKDER